MPLNDPVPSVAADVLERNVQDFDRFVVGAENKFVNRLGVEKLTVTGIISTANESIANIQADGAAAIDALRVVNAGSFEDGATITARNEVLYYLAEQTYYRWDGALPKTVPPASTPASTGGVGVGAWVDVGDAALRSDLFSSYGIKNISNGVVTVESIADLSGLPAEVVRSDLSYSVGGFGAIPGGEFELITDSSLSENYLNVINYTGNQYFVRKGVHFGQLEYTVGPTGDYKTLNELIRAQSLKRKAYTGTSVGSGFYFIRAILQPEYVFNEQIIAFGGVDLSWLQIDGEGREYTVEMASINRDIAAERPLFGAQYNSVLPFITNIQFRPDNSGDGQSVQSSRGCIYVRQSSKVLFSNLDINGFPGVGVFGEYFGEIEGRSSNVRNNRINFSIRHDSFFHGRSPSPTEYGNTTGYEWDCTGATEDSVLLEQMGSFYLRSADHRGTSSPGYGIRIQDCPGAGYSCFEASADRVFVRNSILTLLNATGVSDLGFVLLHFGKIFCRGDLTVSSLEPLYGSEVVCTGNYTGGYATFVEGSKGVFNNLTLNTPSSLGHVLEARINSEVLVNGDCAINGGTNYNVLATAESKIYLPANSDLTYQSGVGPGAVRARSGSRVTIGANSNCTRDGDGTARPADIRISGPGAVIQVLEGVLGGTWVTPNELTFDGIIYRSV